MVADYLGVWMITAMLVTMMIMTTAAAIYPDGDCR